jgi:hypothetical protein
MDKSEAPSIYSPPLINVDQNDLQTIYHPLKHQLNIDPATSYNYRSWTNLNIIQRRFSSPDQQIREQVCKY